MRTKLIIRLTGKASKVFNAIELLARALPDKTLGELEKELSR